MKSLTAMAGSLIALAVAAQPAAAQTYDWTLTGVDTGSGTFFTGAAAGGGLDVLGFTGTIDGVMFTEIGGTPGGSTISPSGGFDYDNLFFPGSDPSLDVYGILVSYNGQEANLFSNGPGDYEFYAQSGPQTLTGDVFSTSFVPEPASLAVLVFGLGLVGYARRRRAI